MNAKRHVSASALASIVLGATLLLAPGAAHAQASRPGAAFAGRTSDEITAKCAEVYKKVYAEVKEKPSKVITVVENYMVTDEPCACEIVRGAIDATSANALLRQQIAMAAINIAPAQAQVIYDCLGMKPTVQPSENGEGDYDRVIPPDIRGVYLIEPMGPGFNNTTTTTTKTVTKVVKVIDHTPTTPNNPTPPPHHPTPVSPSTGGP